MGAQYFKTKLSMNVHYFEDWSYLGCSATLLWELPITQPLFFKFICLEQHPLLYISAIILDYACDKLKQKWKVPVITKQKNMLWTGNGQEQSWSKS
jgi:hypothetical protein